MGLKAAGIATAVGLTGFLGGAFSAVLNTALPSKSEKELKEAFFKEFEAYLLEVSGKKPLELLEANPKKVLKGEEVYKLVKPCVVEINSPIGTGSGVFYQHTDLLITN